MGRKKELVASKSFTLGLSELKYMEKKCNQQGIKASKFLNMTGNLLVDVASITALEEIRYMLASNEATLEEVEKIRIL